MSDMTERMEEIRRRFEDDPSSDNVFDASDIAILLDALAQAERERDHAQEGARLAYSASDAAARWAHELEQERDAAQAEVARLTTDNELLRALAGYPLTPTGSKLLERTAADLAQAERERDEAKAARNRSAEYGMYLDKELDAARAEVERLKARIDQDADLPYCENCKR